MAQAARQISDSNATIRVAATLAAAVALVALVGAKLPVDAASALASLAPIALMISAFMAGALAATRVAALRRRPVLGAAALTGLAPFAPILPAPEHWALFAAFGIFGLMIAGSLGAVIAAFSRERLASLGGATGLGLIGAIAVGAGLAAGPTMQLVLGLTGVVACLAIASVVATAPAAAR
ncbi:hypothetical protein K32_45680 [Kaistia sp. 32K]|uniref:hypothetical protein n=1 Tax=Kaistia sp. 32K TaxID=2795690 RepID=UPI001915028C|nr:hypothetical protein [Kaistia sp. 32K]BCP55951.1 hypothetical protein K32_45680 [Kaistia sp. 32K]